MPRKASSAFARGVANGKDARASETVRMRGWQRREATGRVMENWGLHRARVASTQTRTSASLDGARAGRGVPGGCGDPLDFRGARRALSNDAPHDSPADVLRARALGAPSVSRFVLRLFEACQPWEAVLLAASSAPGAHAFLVRDAQLPAGEAGNIRGRGRSL